MKDMKHVLILHINIYNIWCILINAYLCFKHCFVCYLYNCRELSLENQTIVCQQRNENHFLWYLSSIDVTIQWQHFPILIKNSAIVIGVEIWVEPNNLYLQRLIAAKFLILGIYIHNFQKNMLIPSKAHPKLSSQHLAVHSQIFPHWWTFRSG